MRDHLSDHIRNEHIHADHFVDMMNGFLDRSRCNAMLNHVSDCAECEATFRDVLVIHETIPTWGQPVRDPSGRWTLASAPESVPEPPRAQTRTDSPSQSRWHRFRPLPAMAAVIATVVAFVVWSPWQSTGPSMDYWIAAGESVLPRGDTATVQLNDAIAAYDRHELDLAIDLLSEIELTGSMKTFRTVYLASALTLAGRNVEAAAALRPLSERRLPEPWGSEVRWLDFVLTDRTGDTEAANAILRELAERNGPVKKRAREHLDWREEND